MNAVESPAAQLRAWSDRARKNAFPLPKQETESHVWSGIGFRLGVADLVAPLGSAVEVSAVPTVVPVPRAKPWLVGVANVRGGLLPIVDLQGFLSGHAATDPGRWVITFRTGDVTSGVLVHGVAGLRHFADEDESGPPLLDTALAPYVPGGFRDSERHWGRFDFARLARNPEFLQVGWMTGDRLS